MKKIKIENYILIMLAFFSVSMGLWENFRQLWLQDNNFTVTNISNIISIGTLISVIGIFFIGKSIKVEKLKNIKKCYNFVFNYKIYKCNIFVLLKWYKKQFINKLFNNN